MLDSRETKEYRQWRVSVTRRDSTCVNRRFNVANGVTLFVNVSNM